MGAYAIALLFAGLALSSCTKLDEKMYSELDRATEGGAVDPDNLLLSAYTAMNYRQIGSYWRGVEICTDEALIPSRSGSWYDYSYQGLHMHIHNADNGLVQGTFEELLKAQFLASDVLRTANASAQQKAQARFIRALAMYDVLSLWGFVLDRENMDDFAASPIVLSPQAAIAFIQQDIEAAIPDLPAFKKTEAYAISKEAAKVLQMKFLLNKGAFLNPASPTFEKADMDKVLALAAEIRAGAPSLKLSAGKAYYDNFAPLNDQISDENIFTLYNHPEDGRQGGLRLLLLFPSFDNQKPAGWGGAAWCSMGKFYNLFEEGDIRRGTNYNGYDGDGVANPGKRTNVGFLLGQQYDLDLDTALREPVSKKPMIFTKDINVYEKRDDFRTRGIRVNKYPFDYNGSLGDLRNDWAVFSYADVRLMEAEAVLRGGTGGSETALDIVNELRQERGASALTSVSLKDDEVFQTKQIVDEEGLTVDERTATTHGNLISERGREVYWEGWRREDLIRFGKFLEPGQVKNYVSSPHVLLYPVPNRHLPTNPNLRQNPGY